MPMLRRCYAVLAAFSLAFAVSLLGAQRAAAIDLQPVMLQYQAVPGSTGFFYGPASSTAGLNNSRKVVAWNGWAADPFPDNGIFMWENGVLTDVLRSDDVANAPGIGQPVVQTQPGFIDHNGNIAAPASFGDDQDDVNYIGPNRAGLVFVNRVEGANAPGNAAPWQPFVSVEGNNNGQMVFYGRVGNNNLGLWRGTSSANLVRLAQEQVTPVPGTAEVIKSVAFETPFISSSGLSLLRVSYGISEKAILIGKSDADLQVIARTNYLDVPGMPAGTKFNELFKVAINNNGHAVIAGYWGPEANGLFTTARGLLEPVILSGITQVPGVPGEAFDAYPNSETLSGNDEIFFSGTSQTTKTNGLFKWHDGVLSSLVLEGQSAPGSASTFESITAVHTNATGDVMFVAYTADDNQGLWHIAAGTTTPQLQLITGMNVDVLGNGADIRPIAEITMANSMGGPQGGDLLRFNDNGDFLVKLAFEAGPNTRPLEGLYISSVVPEPATLALASLAAVGALTLRRRD